MSFVSRNGTAIPAMDSDVDLTESHQGSVIACAVVTWVIAAVFVGMRFYLRGWMMKVLGREDWVILASLVVSAGMSAGLILETHYGLGKHTMATPAEDLVLMSETSWFVLLWFAITVSLTKISILLLYMRTLTYDWVQRALWVLMTMVILTFVTNVGLVATACIPLRAYWDLDLKTAYCHSTQVYYAILGIQLGTDFLIFLLPLPVICSMRAPRDQKIMLFTLFSFGFFICITSIIRLSELNALKRSTDYPYTSVKIDYWSMIEVNTGIVCACVMTLKPLIVRLVPAKLIDSRNPQHHTNGIASAAFGTKGLIHPPTIGSQPPQVARKQSWLTVQLARLDRSIPTVDGTGRGRSRSVSNIRNNDDDDDDTINLSMLEPSGAAARIYHHHESVSPPMPCLSIPSFISCNNRQGTNNSSVVPSPVEHKPDEGPLEPVRYAG